MTEKTYKREAASILLTFLMGLVGVWVFGENLHAAQAVEVLLTPFITFAGMAFGLDAYAKQIKGSKDDQ